MIRKGPFFFFPFFVSFFFSSSVALCRFKPTTYCSPNKEIPETSNMPPLSFHFQAPAPPRIDDHIRKIDKIEPQINCGTTNHGKRALSPVLDNVTRTHTHTQTPHTCSHTHTHTLQSAQKHPKISSPSSFLLNKSIITSLCLSAATGMWPRHQSSAERPLPRPQPQRRLGADPQPGGESKIS